MTPVAEPALAMPGTRTGDFCETDRALLNGNIVEYSPTNRRYRTTKRVAQRLQQQLQMQSGRVSEHGQHVRACTLAFIDVV
jgi:hypothetical protein